MISVDSTLLLTSRSSKIFPIHLAYAVTVHKLQGLTLDWLVIHCAHIRRFGQFYTALSRVRSVDRVRVEGFVRTQAVKADPRALTFYAELRQAAAAGGPAGGPD